METHPLGLLLLRLEEFAVHRHPDFLLGLDLLVVLDQVRVYVIVLRAEAKEGKEGKEGEEASQSFLV